MIKVELIIEPAKKPIYEETEVLNMILTECHSVLLEQLQTMFELCLNKYSLSTKQSSYLEHRNKIKIDELEKYGFDPVYIINYVSKQFAEFISSIDNFHHNAFVRVFLKTTPYDFLIHFEAAGRLK